MPTVIVLTSGSGKFLIPADFPSGGTLQVECVGAGGLANAGGGAYSKTNAITGISPLQTVYFQAGGTGTDSWFNKTSNAAPTSTADGCLAKAGTPDSTTDLAPGGQASAGIGDVKYSGGNGGSYDSIDNIVFGGGGGAAGPNGNGANAGGYPNTGGGGANGGSTGSGTTGGNGRLGSGGGITGNGSNGGGGAGKVAGVSTTPGSGGPDLIWTDFAGVQWGVCGGGGGPDPDGLGGIAYGGGACRASDITSSGGVNANPNTARGIVVLTYEPVSATASFTDVVIGQLTSITAQNPYQYLGYWYVPLGVSSVDVAAVGGSATALNSFGGGAYAFRTISATAGGALYLFAGSGHQTANVDTWVNTSNAKPSSDSSSVVLAKGAVSNTGGTSAASYGSTKFSGGNAGSTAIGAGNGGSAGPSGTGKNGGTGTTSGTSGLGGGGGGANGGSSTAGGNAGTFSSRNGGIGGNNRLGSGGGTRATSTVNATNGSDGGGGGGGSINAGATAGLLAGYGSVESIWTSSLGDVYGVNGGNGGRSILTSNVQGFVTPPSTTVIGSGSTDKGLIVFTFTYVPPVVTNNGNFFMFF